MLSGAASWVLETKEILAPAVFREKLRNSDDSPSARLNVVLRGLLPNSALISVYVEPTYGKPIPSLIDGLNEVIRRADLYERIDPDEFELEREARSMAKTPSSELSQAQIERRNRLLLEAVYPQYIRKLYGLSWRYVMMVYGGVGILVAMAFWLGYRDRPRDHPSCNAAEIGVIEGGRPAGVTKPHGKVGD